MSVEAERSAATGDEAEIARLQERIASLEAQLLETEAWANRVVAEAQDKTYWLDRWHLDLNALMRRRTVGRILALADSFAFAVYRIARKLGRQLSP
jgi:molecular chaperone GrpE (heat shock protein)